jgi:hypothetical protein
MRLALLLSMFVLFAAGAKGQSVSDPKAECEGLMNTALPFAEQMLARHGEFYPYGQALTLDGRVVAVAVYDGQENPPAADVIRLLKQAFVMEAKKGKYRATALVYDVRVTIPSSGVKSDAIAVSLNHKEHYSVVVFFPYRIEGGKVIRDQVFADKGESDVFNQ